jgi:hypothetical protein
VNRGDLEQLDAVIKDPARSETEARKAAQAIERQSPFRAAVIQVNPKIDAHQRRLQCSLRFGDFSGTSRRTPVVRRPSGLSCSAWPCRRNWRLRHGPSGRCREIPDRARDFLGRQKIARQHRPAGPITCALKLPA